MKDAINYPAHYTQGKGGIEPLDYIVANNLNFLEGNIIKYVTRYQYKNGTEDLEKAKFYINKLIEDYKDIEELVGLKGGCVNYKPPHAMADPLKA